MGYLHIAPARGKPIDWRTVALLAKRLLRIRSITLTDFGTFRAADGVRCDAYGNPLPITVVYRDRPARRRKPRASDTDSDTGARLPHKSMKSHALSTAAGDVASPRGQNE